MDDFLRLTDDKSKKHHRKTKAPIHRNVTAERIEKLKKTFQPYWMRGMILHRNDGDQAPDEIDHFDGV
jgi:hypothetical protein